MQRTVRIQLFMTEADEAEFSFAIRVAEPATAFIDGQRWPTAEPPLVPTISDATSSHVYLWSPRVVPRLAALERPDGTLQGPSIGPVVQFERSRMVDGELRSGRIAAGLDDANVPLAAFVRTVVHVLKGITTDNLVTLAGHRHPYRMGRGAARWATMSDANRLRDRSSTAVYFEVIGSHRPST